MILDRYLGKQIFVSSLLVLLTFWGIFILLDFVHELGKLTSGTHKALTAFYEALYPAAGHLYTLLPASVLMGSLLSFGALAQQSELLAARAAGYSRRRIIWSALRASIVFIIAMAIIGELLIPVSEKARAEASVPSNKFQETEFDIWARDGHNFIHAIRKDENDIYHDVSIYEYDGQGNLLLLTHADTMRLGKKHIHLEQVRVAELSDNQFTTMEMEQKSMLRTVAVDASVLRPVSPQRLSFGEMIEYIRFLKESKLRSNLHQLALWQRISQPFSIIVLLLIAMPFVFSAVRSPSAGQRLFFGIVIGLTYTIVDKTIGSLAIIYQWPEWLGAFTLPGICFIGGIWYQIRYH